MVANTSLITNIITLSIFITLIYLFIDKKITDLYDTKIFLLFKKLEDKFNTSEQQQLEMIKIQKIHSQIYNKFIDKESFFKELDLIRENVMSHIIECDKAISYVGEQIQSAKDMINWFDQQEILMVSPELFEAWAAQSIIKSHIIFENLFNTELKEKYFEMCHQNSIIFKEDIDLILLDTINDKKKAIKIRTLDFVRKITSSFVKFYFIEIKPCIL